MTQSVISAYECGARQPSLPTLARLVEATGSELEVHVTSPGPSRTPDGLLATEADLPWAQNAGMRDRLAHSYFDTSHIIIAATVEDNLPQLEAATRRLLQRVEDS